jgi:hypothetical protein
LGIASAFADDPLFSVVTPAGNLEVAAGQSLSLAILGDILATTSANPDVCSVSVNGENKRQTTIIGLKPGATTVSFTIKDLASPITYSVRIVEEQDLYTRRQELAAKLMMFIATAYPLAKVNLVVAPTGKLIARGTVPDHATAGSIIKVLTGDLFPENMIVNELGVPCVAIPCVTVPCCTTWTPRCGNRAR